MVDEATTYQNRWKENFPYVPPAMYAVMGQPTKLGVLDKNWRDFFSTVEVSKDTEKAGREAE